MQNNRLTKYSFGVGDRFAQEAEAQLLAFEKAAQAGVDITPVWNKSNREHVIVGSEPAETRRAVETAVKKCAWSKPYFCDADHINLQTVDRFLAPCDFFTIDVADRIGQPVDQATLQSFIARHPELKHNGGTLETAANKYLAAVRHAAEIYSHIESAKGRGNFVTEISMDETDYPQTPAELLIILAAISDHRIPIQTIAPKFSGRFNKGVDYVGDLAQFKTEFAEDISVIRHAADNYGLPADLKLSVHSGSDKFSIYPTINEVLRQTGAGVHVKTAGTTWLEEIIGLAEAGGDGLALAKEIYSEAYGHREELCAPYAAVIDIDLKKLPPPAAVNGWSSEQFTAALKHDPKAAGYNSSLRQLLHVAFKIAAKIGPRFLQMLATNRTIIAKNVTANLFERHISPIFLG